MAGGSGTLLLMIEVLTTYELLSRAGSRSRARRPVEHGDYLRVMHGAYVQGGEDVTAPVVRLAAARRVMPRVAVLSHRSVLWLLGEDCLERGLLHVMVPRGRHLRHREGLVVHSGEVLEDELVVVRGVPMTSAARAVLDVARSEPLEVGVAYGDRSLRLGHAVEGEIVRLLERAEGLRGVVRAREVAGLLNGRSESWNESVLRVRLLQGGLSGLDVQYDVWTDTAFVCRADLHLGGVVVEFDGRTVRLRRSLFTPERRRQTRIAEAGFELRRFTQDDLDERTPSSLADEVRRAVVLAASRDRSRVVPGQDTLRVPQHRPLPTLAQVRRAA